MGKDSSPSTGCSLYGSAQARSNSRLIDFYFHIVRICKPCIFACKVWLTLLIRRSRVIQKTLFVCSFLCLFRMCSKPVFYQPLWDRGPVNSFSTRRGPGPNRFTGKYLSIFFLSSNINPLVLELDIYSSAHRLCKMWIFYEPRRVTLGNTRHFVEG
jgi:hypothetical protein